MTYKSSQDHLELFFGALRSHFGSNNNPTATQLEAAFKCLLVPRDIKGHCSSSDPQDNTKLLISLSCCKEMRQSYDVTDNNDMTEEVNLDLYCNGIGKFKKAVVGYIAAYVVKMAEQNITCEECLSSLHNQLEHLIKHLKATANSSHAQ